MFITDAFEPLEGGAGGSWAHYWYYTLALWMCRCLLPTRFKAGLVGTGTRLHDDDRGSAVLFGPSQ